MTITQLHYVLAVAEHQNFTRAAEKVFVTQPTLSMQIQKLEEELDIQIFDRGKKPIQLTEVGQKIVTQAKNIVNESGRIKDIVDQQKGYIGGDFKVGIIPTIMPTLLPMFMSNFINKYPKVNLIIEERTTEEIIKMLKNGQLDAAIAATPLNEETIKEIVLYYEPFVAYVPENNPAYQKKEFDVHDLEMNLSNILLLQDGHCFRNNVLNICKATSLPSDNHFQIESGSFETMIRLANEGLGMTLLPYLHTLDMEDKSKREVLEAVWGAIDEVTNPTNYPDYCAECYKVEGNRLDTYSPKGVAEKREGGNVYWYECTKGHYWTCYYGG